MKLQEATVKSFGIKASETDDNRVMSFVMSNDSVDRDGEVLLPDGLDAVNFLKNPVFMYQHGKDVGGKTPIGRVLKITREGNQWFAKAHFVERPDAHPVDAEWLPDTLLHLAKSGCLNAVSVGFIPHAMRNPTASDKKMFGTSAKAVTSRWELLELSLVSVPCNQDALRQLVTKGLVQSKSAAWDGEVMPVPPIADANEDHPDAPPEPRRKCVVIASSPPAVKRVIEVNTKDITKIVIVRARGGLYA